MRIAVTGATGFLGRALCLKLQEHGHTVLAFSRNAEKAQALLGEEVTCYTWETPEKTDWQKALAETDAVIHLAGESVAGERWTPAFKQRLTTSRVETTRRLVNVLCAANPRPKTLISASAVGYYGDRGDEILTEDSEPGTDFLGQMCQQWEAETQRAAECGLREVRLRIGIVLGDGGSLEKMLYPLPLPISPWKLGLGGPLGSGKQWLPWVHVQDIVGMVLWALENPAVSGAVNATAPNPVTNAEFSRALGRVLHRPAVLPVPAFALRAMLGEFAQVVLGGQRVMPTIAEQHNYTFQYNDVEQALHSLLK